MVVGTTLASVVLVESVLLVRMLSQRSQLERCLRTVRDRLTFAWRAARLGVMEIDSSNGSIWVNEQFRHLLQFDAGAEITFARILAAIHPQDRPSLQKGIRAAMTSQEAVVTELRLLPADHESRWVSITLFGSARSCGATGPVKGMVTEITERRALDSDLHNQRQQLAHLTRVSLLGELSGALAHELNQPLTSILSNAEAAQFLLGEGELDRGEIRDILSDIVSDDKRAGDVIRRLRALLVRGETQSQRVEIQQLLRDVMTLQNSDLIARSVRLRTRIPEYIPAVRADRVELQQVFLNLILNACEAMSANAPEDRIVEVSAVVADDPGEVHLSVVDRGKGMTTEQLDHVFDPFFTTKSSGLGVGLAICRSIVTAHSGHIWATNGVERGAAFHFTVPVFKD